MRKLSIFIIFLLLLICIVETVYIYNSKQLPVSTSLQSQLDSVNNIIDSLKSTNNKSDSIIKIVDKEIIILNKNYEKDFNTILTQSTDSDCRFFSEYLSENSSRLINSNNK